MNAASVASVAIGLHRRRVDRRCSFGSAREASRDVAFVETVTGRVVAFAPGEPDVPARPVGRDHGSDQG